jgi:hypothetical protein
MEIGLLLAAGRTIAQHTLPYRHAKNNMPNGLDTGCWKYREPPFMTVFHISFSLRMPLNDGKLNVTLRRQQKKPAQKQTRLLSYSLRKRLTAAMESSKAICRSIKCTNEHLLPLLTR